LSSGKIVVSLTEIKHIGSPKNSALIADQERFPVYSSAMLNL